MTSIKWDPTDPLPRADSRDTTLRPTRSSSAVPGLQSTEQDFTRARQQLTLSREAPTLAHSLEERIQRLARAVNAFTWPDAFPDNTQSPDNARLARFSTGLHDSLSATFPAEPAPYDRFFSKGFDRAANAAHALQLAPGDYSFEITHQGETQELTVTLDQDMTMPDLLDAVAQAVNNSELNVQARQINQGSPHQHAPGQVATGRSLALSVNPTYGAPPPALRDTSGHLLAALDLRENPQTPSGNKPATSAAYSLELTALHRPTTLRSTAVDPGATPPLEPGSYDFAYTHGNDSGTFSMDIQSSDTWEDVLQRFANTANSSQGGFTVALRDQDRTSTALPAGEWGDLRTRGLALDITASAPKLGQRLQLGADESGSDADAAQTFLQTLRINASAQPGTDATLRLQGQEYTRAPGVFAPDQGRVLLEQQHDPGSGELRVQQAYETMVEQLQDVTLAYNDLRSFLLADPDLFAPGLAESWRAPLKALAATSGNSALVRPRDPEPHLHNRPRHSMELLGIQEYGAEQRLWFDHDAFFAGLGAQPEQMRDLLLDPEQGLLPRWTALAQSTNPSTALAHGLAPQRPHSTGAALTTNSTLPDPFQPDLTPRTETELEQHSILTDILDELDTEGILSLPGKGILDRSG